LFSLLAMLIASQASMAEQKVVLEKLDKPRVIVLTDITNEPDDEESMVRFLVYSNEFDVEGLVATTSVWLRNKVRPDKIRERIEAYGRVRDNLLRHAPGYPTREHLLSVTKAGLPEFGMQGVGEGKSSEGSRHIIEVVDEPDDRPVWVSVWGGPNCLAQALREVKNTRSKEKLDAFVSKLRVYTISDQDDSGRWLRLTFPKLFYIVTPSSEVTGNNPYHFGGKGRRRAEPCQLSQGHHQYKTLIKKGKGSTLKTLHPPQLLPLPYARKFRENRQFNRREKVLASRLTACDLFGWLVIYLLRGWFLNCLSPAFAAASAEYAPMKKPREALEFN